MRVVVLGGTRFIGRAIVEELAAHGHELLVVHRGRSEPDDLPAARHLHIERRQLPQARPDLLAFAPEAAVDTFAMTAEDADLALAALPDDIPAVVLSSGDVYRAYTALRLGLQTEPLPIDEQAPVREDRYPYRGEQLPGDVDVDHYEKLDVEPRYLRRGGTVLRLGIVFGEHDSQAREDFVLRRLRHGRRRIPVGTGTLLLSRVWVRDVARAVAAAIERPEPGEVFNIAERHTLPVKAWIEQILRAAGAEAELVTVPDDALPPDLALTGASQHLLLDTHKARERLAFHPTEADAAVRRSVAWHLAHPPADDDTDFSADDGALAHA
jgi:nucleoside-diphosphate-sugar epimerase